MGKHHYLPKCYLRNFTDPSALTPCKTPYVWIYEAKKGLWKRRSPANTAVRPNYYSYPEINGAVSTELEAWLAELESKTGSILRMLAESDAECALALSDGQRQTLAQFAMCTFVRTPDPEDGSHLFGQPLFSRGPQGTNLRRVKQALRRHGLDPCEVMKSVPWQLAVNLRELDVLATFLAAKRWSFLHSQPPNYFITSDSPLGIVSRSPAQDARQVLLSAETVFTFPLNRHLALKLDGLGRTISWVPARTAVVCNFNLVTASGARLLVAPSVGFPGRIECEGLVAGE